ncbi:MAG: hypothetical protein KDD40_09720 [Bdellovibrionales bacterium]|nr:hypothetical protein [Bdellovibrionales bacterium]
MRSENTLVDYSKPDHYFVRDSSDTHLFVIGSVSKQGDLVLNLRTKGPDGQRNKKLSGKDQFKKILNHFGGQFSAIKGVWVASTEFLGSNFDGINPVHAGDNLSAFNHALREGYDVGQAAFMTWTGRQAALNGYSELDSNSIQLHGNYGNYYSVIVRFVQP